MKQYLDLMKDVLENGREKADRTGTGTLSVFGRQMRFDLTKGFPLVTTKKCHLRSIIHELLWFLKGDTNVKTLQDNGVSIWNEWMLPDGTIGRGYGKQWRDWKSVVRVADNPKLMAALKAKGYREVGDVTDGHVKRGAFLEYSYDQIQTVIDQLRNDPDNRRIIVSAWNVAELDQMALAPCHAFFQFYTHVMTYSERLQWVKDNAWESYDAFQEAAREALSMQDATHEEIDDDLVSLVDAIAPKRALSCQLYQRSADIFLGVPFNIASYAMLIHMVALQVDMAVGEFVWTGGDTHLYSNHLEQAKLQLTRDPMPLPKLIIKQKAATIFDYKFEDFEVEGYESHAPIKAPVAI